MVNKPRIKAYRSGVTDKIDPEYPPGIRDNFPSKS